MQLRPRFVKHQVAYRVADQLILPHVRRCYAQASNAYGCLSRCPGRCSLCCKEVIE